MYTDVPEYTGLLTYEVIEGRNFLVQLSLTGNPFPLLETLRWSFNGQLLSVGENVNFGLDFVEFLPINRANGGSYDVFSSNSLGNATFGFTIDVLCKLLRLDSLGSHANTTGIATKTAISEKCNC